MPAPRHTSYSPMYVAIRNESSQVHETNDCAVVATAAATGVAYADVLAAMTQFGRRARRGTPMRVTKQVVELFGFQMEWVDRRTFIAQYPGVHKQLRNVTTHHPERFKKVWADGHTYFLRTKGHILTVRNGENVDWTRGKALRVIEVYKVSKKVP